MTPTIVLKDGKVVLVTGSPGGRTIINTVLRVVLGVTEYGLTGRAGGRYARASTISGCRIARRSRQRRRQPTARCSAALTARIEATQVTTGGRAG